MEKSENPCKLREQAREHGEIFLRAREYFSNF
jgi:hypothetical protein